MPLVFVYGTLMRGQRQNGALAGEEFVAEAITEPRYRLYDCGRYPALVEADDGNRIAGEVWQVSPACLARLDEIESVTDGLYERRRIALESSPVTMPVEAYFYLPDVTGLPDLGERWRGEQASPTY